MDKCLFCVDKITQFKVSENSTSDDESKINLPNFKELCKYLDLDITELDVEEFKAYSILNPEHGDSITCNTFLCLNCFELAEKLGKLYKEIDTIQLRISAAKGEIRNIIINGPINSPVSGSRKRSLRGRKKCPSKGFDEKFRQLVKDKANTSGSEGSPKKPQDIKLIKGLKVVVSKLELKPVDTVWKRAIKLETCKDESFEIENNGDSLFSEMEDILDDANDVEDSHQNSTTEQLESSSKPDEKIDNSEKDEKKLLKAEPDKLILRLECKECGKTFSRKNKYYYHRRTRHPFDIPEDLEFPVTYKWKNGKRIAVRTCPLCGYTSRGTTLSVFMKHTLSHETDPKSLDSANIIHSCDVCERQYSLKLNVQLHKLLCHISRSIILKCDICGDTSCKTREDLIDHLKTNCNVDTLFSCKSCPMVCTTLNKLLQHMVKHSTNKVLFCPVCPVVVESIRELCKHCSKSHSDIKNNIQCAYCDKSFLISSAYERHLLTVHNNGIVDSSSEDLICIKCTSGKIFPSKKALENHIYHQHESDKTPHYKCSQCDKAFQWKHLLEEHIKKVHEGLRHLCPHCPKSFASDRYLKFHLKMHTGEDLFTCEDCGKTYLLKDKLRKHSLTHAESNFVCEVCGKAFKDPANLKKHENIHKDKSIECEHCGLKFRRWDHLKSHLRTHTGERPFVCPTCSKGFNRRDILLVHMKMHGFTKSEAAVVYDSHFKSSLE